MVARGEGTVVVEVVVKEVTVEVLVERERETVVVHGEG